MLNYFQDGYGALRLKDGYAIFDSTGKITYETKNTLSTIYNNHFFIETDSDKNQTLIESKSGKKFALPTGSSAETIIPSYNHIIITVNIGTPNRKCGVFDYVQQKEVVKAKFWDIRHWQNGIYRVSFSYGEHTYVNALSGKQYFNMKDEYKIYTFRGESELQHKYTGKNIFDRKFKEIQPIYGNDSIFIAKENGKTLLLHAGKKKISEEYDMIDIEFNHFFVKRNQLMGVLNQQLETIVPIQYKNIKIIAETKKTPLVENLILVEGKIKKGLYDLSGKMIADTVFSHIYNSEKFVYGDKGTNYATRSFTYFSRKGEYYKDLDGATNVREFENSSWCQVYFGYSKQLLYNTSNNKIIKLPEEIRFERLVNSSMKTMHFYFKKGKKYGIMDENGKIVLNAKEYDYMCPTDSPLQFLSNKTKSIVVKAENEKLILKPESKLSVAQYTLMNYDSEFEKKWRYSLQAGKEVKLVDENLNQIGNETYLSLYEGEHFIIAFNKNGKAGAIDQSGKLIIPYEYEKHEFVDVWGYEVFVKNKKYYFYNEDGKLCFSNLSIDAFPYYDFMDDEKTVVVRSNKKYILLERENEKVILDNIISLNFDEELYYTDSDSFPDGEKLILVTLESGTGLYSLASKSFIVQPQFTEITLLNHYESESVFLLTKNEKGFNLYDPKSKQFAFETEAKEIVSIGKENTVITFLVNGKIHLVHKVFDDKTFKIIPTSFGKEKLTFKYNSDLLINEHEIIDGFEIFNGKKKGLLLMNGTLLHPPTLESHESDVYGGKYIIVRKEGKLYILDVNGNYIFQEGFDLIELMLDGNLLAIGLNIKGKKQVEFDLYSDGKIQMRK
jgi:hypothetical protein